MAAYTTIDDPEAYFQVKTYTGTGSSLAITLDGDTDLSANMIWTKGRSYSSNHNLFDTVRGATTRVYPHSTSAENTDSETLKSFDSDGFTLGTQDNVNTSTETYVAWCWKETADAGFDIISYAGDGNAGRSLSHSLSAVPHWIMLKNRDDAVDWFCYHRGMTDDYNNKLNTDDAEFGGAYIFDPTSSIFKLRDHNVTNDSGDDYIAFAWSEKQGFSKFGKYTGNGNDDGAFIYTGFRPAYVCVKQIDANRAWNVYDNKRFTLRTTTSGYGYNTGVDMRLYPNTAGDEENYASFDFVSNGFKARTDNAYLNDGTYIYMAFAEAPLVNSNGVPCNAR